MGLQVKPSFGHRVSATLLRVVVGLTFLWAGLGKFAADEPLKPEQRQLYIDAGLIKDDADQTAPVALEDTSEPRPADPPVDPEPSIPDQPETAAPEPPPEPPPEPDSRPNADAPPSDVVERVARWKNIAALVYSSAHREQPADADQERAQPQPIRLLPAFAATGSWPKVLAILLGIAEIIFGVCVVAGFLSRLSGVALAGVMLTAIWLTHIGPMVQQGAMLYDSIFDMRWSKLWWQLLLLASTLAVAFLGAGSVALDNTNILRRKHPQAHDDD